MSFFTNIRIKLEQRKKKKNLKKIKLNKNIQELFSAIANEDFQLASNIIKSGKVGIECEDHSRATPLIAVCRIPNCYNEKERMSFVKFLIQNGASPLVIDKGRKSSNVYAEENNLMELALYLNKKMEVYLIEKCFI